MKLSDNTYRKFTEVLDTDEWEVLSENNEWANITSSNKTIPYRKYIVKLENGMFLECADTHILITSSHEEVFAHESLGNVIITDEGVSRVVSVEKTDIIEEMYDLSLDSENHTFLSNGILSHNSVTTIAYLLHFIIFNEYKRVGIIANKGATARKILGKLKLAYENLPHWIQSGVLEWNKGSIELENGCIVEASSTSGDAVRGDSLALLFVDECIKGDSMITVRDKETGIIKQITIEELYTEA